VTQPNSKGFWIAATGIVAAIIVGPLLLQKTSDTAQPAIQTQQTAYEGERPPHPLDGKQGRNGSVEDILQPDCKATYEKFRALKAGQFKSHVRRVMNDCEGELISDSRIGGTRYSTYQWRGDGIAVMQIVFKDREILSINQFGLK
jgi:hypothetical protein